MHTRLGVMMVALVLVAATAGAQELAGSFDQLRVLVTPGQTITVVDAAGARVKGTIVALTPTTLRLTVAGIARDMAERDVDQIRQRRPDSLANGAKAGFVAGLAFGLVGAVAAMAESGGDEWGFYVLGAALYGGLGAGIGVGIDALIESEQPIYARRPGGSTRLTWSPIGHAGQKGAQLGVRF